MASALESFVNRQVSIITADGRNFVGLLKGFDQTINIILDDTHERVFSTTQGVEQVRFSLVASTLNLLFSSLSYGCSPALLQGFCL